MPRKRFRPARVIPWHPDPAGEVKRLPTRMPQGDFNYRPTPGGVHLVHCIEQDAPGVFEIRCSCGQVTWTPWGIDSAAEIGTLHLWSVGAPLRRVTQR